MRQAGNYYFPDRDRHFDASPYQIDKLRAAIKYVVNTGTFLDVGAHCGTWSLNALIEGFEKVICVEPLGDNIECLEKTLEGENYRLIKGAAGNDEIVKIIPGKLNTGGTEVEYGSDIKDGFQKVIRLDDVIDEPIDLMKIDVQGMERSVLEGARLMINKYHPIIIVEQKANGDAIPYLRSLGYLKQKKMNGDYIFI